MIFGWDTDLSFPDEIKSSKRKILNIMDSVSIFILHIGLFLTTAVLLFCK